MNHIAIIGASLAGVSAIEGLRAADFNGDITLVDAEPALPYDKPPLSKQALIDASAYDQLPLRPREWYGERGVTLQLGRRAIGLNVEAKTVYLQGGGEVGYGGLLIATGSAARPLTVLDDGTARTHQLRTLADYKRLRIELRPGRHLVVVGAGFIGLEVAATARKLKLDVTVVECTAAPLYRAFGLQLGQWFRRLHESNGVTVHCGVSVVEINSGPTHSTICLSDGSILTADVVLSGVGAIPQTKWLAGSRITIADGICCQNDLSTGAPDVVAAGDVARWHNSFFTEEMRVEHWTNAVEQGRHAAMTLLGERTAYRAVPYFWTDQYDARVRVVGRPHPRDDIVLTELQPNKLVALYGSRGLLHGAVCINAPHFLARYREAIVDRAPWHELAGEFIACTTGPHQQAHNPA